MSRYRDLCLEISCELKQDSEQDEILHFSIVLNSHLGA